MKLSLRKGRDAGFGSFSRSREKAGDEGSTRLAHPHPNPLPQAGEGACAAAFHASRVARSAVEQLT